MARLVGFVWGVVDVVMRGEVWQAWQGKAWHGAVRKVLAWIVKARQARLVEEWRVESRHGRAGKSR